ncbi:MAG: hypothetical protein QOI82_843 [Actinomycetota bacterium]|nr:hypothetical protein [Actinomycetota bacterium]
MRLSAPPSTTHRAPDVGVISGNGALPVVQNIVQRSVQHPEAPIALCAIALLFLLVQHRIDRRDPKLRVAPRGQYEELEFGSAVGLA